MRAFLKAASDSDSLFRRDEKWPHCLLTPRILSEDRATVDEMKAGEQPTMPAGAGPTIASFPRVSSKQKVIFLCLGVLLLSLDGQVAYPADTSVRIREVLEKGDLKTVREEKPWPGTELSDGEQTYEVVEVLGQGSSGTVVLAKVEGTSPPQFTALKIYHQSGPKDERRNLLKKLNEVYSPFTAHFKEVSSTRLLRYGSPIELTEIENGKRIASYVAIPSEVAVGSVSEWIPPENGPLAPLDVRIARASKVAEAGQLALAEFIHMDRFHGDVSPDNFFILPDGTVVLGDPDGSGKIGTLGSAHNESHLAKELFIASFASDHWNRPNAFTDLYSLGSTVYEILTGKLPDRMILRDTARGIYELNPHRDPELAARLHPLTEFILAALRGDPELRRQALEKMQSPSPFLAAIKAKESAEKEIVPDDTCITFLAGWRDFFQRMIPRRNP
jgi:serine/threonine protein kinase